MATQVFTEQLLDTASLISTSHQRSKCSKEQKRITLKNKKKIIIRKGMSYFMALRPLFIVLQVVKSKEKCAKKRHRK